MEHDADQVRLPDLETIRRFSIAVRTEHADVEDVIEALRADLQLLLEATGRIKGGRRAPAEESAPEPKRSAPQERRTSTPARKNPVRGRSTAARRSSASSSRGKGRGSTRRR